jgi:Helix-turn-helix domain
MVVSDESVLAINNEIRFEFARQLLGNTEVPLAQIAAALDYSEASAFSRAFRRWSGETPTAWRVRHRRGRQQSSHESRGGSSHHNDKGRKVDDEGSDRSHRFALQSVPAQVAANQHRIRPRSQLPLSTCLDWQIHIVGRVIIGADRDPTEFPFRIAESPPV